MPLTATIKSIQDIMRKDQGIDGDAQRLGQLAWLLFLKIFDDKEKEREIERKIKKEQNNYQPPIPKRYLWRNWAENKEGITGNELLDFINNDLLPALKNLSVLKDTNPRGYLVKQAFQDTYNYMKNGTILRQVINKLNEIDFNKAHDRHQFGDLYEKILKDLQSAGNAGEFYTPRAVTRFIVNRIDPKPGESIIDPACGTGGFLTCAIDHIQQNYAKTIVDQNALQTQIHGIEKKQLPHLLATTNLLLHGIETPTQIRHGNALSTPLAQRNDQYQIIITNPPFGGIEEDGIEKNFPAEMQTRETADLFLQLIIEILAENGRAAIVLPDGTLFGEGVKTKIKKLLTEQCNLHTIVRLPGGVFNPYTGIKTNLLFFTKGQPTKQIWFYEHPYPAGSKNYSKTRPMKFEEFRAEIAWWGNEADDFTSRTENEQAWKVSIEEIINRNFNLDIKNPHQSATPCHDPNKLLAQYTKQQQEIQSLRNQLRDMLNAALSGKKENT